MNRNWKFILYFMILLFKMNSGTFKNTKQKHKNLLWFGELCTTLYFTWVFYTVELICWGLVQISIYFYLFFSLPDEKKIIPTPGPWSNMRVERAGERPCFSFVCVFLTAPVSKWLITLLCQAQFQPSHSYGLYNARLPWLPLLFIQGNGVVCVCVGGWPWSFSPPFLCEMLLLSQPGKVRVSAHLDVEKLMKIWQKEVAKGSSCFFRHSYFDSPLPM